MLESLKSDLRISIRQRRPAPARPTPLLPAPQASEATWVPCPTVSGGRAAVGVEARGAQHAVGQLGVGRLGAGVDHGDGRARAGPTRPTPAGSCCARPTTRPARPPGCRAPFGRARAGSLAFKRGRPRCSSSTRATRGSARSRTARACSPSPGRARRVTRRIGDAEAGRPRAGSRGERGGAHECAEPASGVSVTSR